MTDMISTPPIPASPASSAVTLPAFWPNLDVNGFRERFDLGGTTVPHARIVEALSFGAITVIDELDAWAVIQKANDPAISEIGDIDSDQEVGGSTRLERLFIRACELHALGDLADNYPDLVVSERGMERAESRKCIGPSARARATEAIRDICGFPRVDSELI